MKFHEVAEHLSKGGFITRPSACSDIMMSVFFFGRNNQSWHAWEIDAQPSSINNLHRWHITFNDMNRHDWIILPDYWNTPLDDYKAFDKNLIDWSRVNV